MKKSLAFLMVCAFSFGSLVAQAALPAIDGTIAANEYAVTGSYGDLTLGVTLSADKSTLSVGVASPGAGWVSAGLGSLKMNGSFMVLAYDDNGKQVFSEDTGKMFGHTPNSAKSVTAEAVREADGKTTLEFTVPAGNFVKDGKLQLILAYSDKDSFRAKHKKYAKTTIDLSK